MAATWTPFVVDEPKRRIERERRPLPGLEDLYEVTRTGLVWSVEFEDWLEPSNWPFIKLEAGERMVDLNLCEVVPLAWLGAEERDALRRELGVQGKPWSDALIERAKALNLPIWAVASACSSASDESFEHAQRLAAKAGSVEHLSIRDAKVEKYTTFLVEYYRPPSRGGNTRALHSHRMRIDGQDYSFLALGTKKWVFEHDTVSFDYYVTPEGYRNVVKHSVHVVDKVGKPQIRGNRGFKAQLRTAPTR